ncbi:hypothetical protein [Desulfitobacterium metallireducens]|uniref:Uncharacterized protein n=1 Tax=Desulfitobacterium metallireducens DSM 15288 TaxID=871968 RepID=W0ECJ3_9FIRM|nr:hypothetical protein [Desulfitobacterium metallireducens]AHF08487.1 hypothetical protein DESME_04835 [Desulfitobacterium metallireducens DSM 15288]
MIKRPFLAFLAFSLGMVFTLTACSSNRTDTTNNNQQAEQAAKSSVSTDSKEPERIRCSGKIKF